MEAAEAFARESGTAPGVDLGAITDRMAIRKAMQAGDVDGAMARVKELDPSLLTEREPLLFHLQQQRLIELIREGRVEEALEFAQTHLVPHAENDPALLAELERTIALLAFDPSSTASPVADLLDVSQRQKTASELNAAILSSQSQEQESRLPCLLKMMLWAQDQLDEKVNFPRINDLVSARLEGPEPGA